MVHMKNHEKSCWVHLIWNPGQVLTVGCGETPGRARTFISDQSKEVSQDRERRRKLHRCIQTTIDSARRDWSSARRDWRLVFQTFQPSFVISWPISTNEPSLESLKSQQGDGAIFVPVAQRERTIAPFLRKVLTLSAQFPRIRTCSGQINLYRGEIAVLGTTWLDCRAGDALSLSAETPDVLVGVSLLLSRTGILDGVWTGVSGASGCFGSSSVGSVRSCRRNCLLRRKIFPLLATS